MKLPRLVPPAWRSLARGRPDPWLVVAAVAGLAGAGWALSPAGLAERLVRKREPTPTGRALGIAAGYELGPTVDPLGVLTGRERLVIGTGATEPRYMARRLPEPVIAPASWDAPVRTQDVRALAAQAPYRRPPAKPGVAITAADVLRPPEA